MGARQLARTRRLVDLGRLDAVGLDAHLAQEIEPARRGGGQHERRPGGLARQIT
jgi:hypothetical protein